jgi:hypothetical protein
MTRTQIQLAEEQLHELRRLAATTGKPIARLVREAVDVYLAAQHRPDRAVRVRQAMATSGRFSSGLKDVSAAHDRYLADAFRE